MLKLILSRSKGSKGVIRFTIPVDYIRSLYVMYAIKFITDSSFRGKHFNLLFLLEFLCESKVLEDNL